MSKFIKVIFVHGNGGGDVNDPKGWFPYLKRKLEKLNLQVISQNFPDPIKARAKYWLPFLKKLEADENTILIGHSSGAVAALRYAEKHQILGSILVSACYTDLGLKSEKISGYYDKVWNWKKIKHNQKWIVQFHSADDPFIPIEEARYIHEKLTTQYYEFKDQGHFGYPRVKREFPEIIDVLKTKLKTV
ncbi:alpha/beta hydrolase [Candidatus Daviesbacteria bacterium]|nr:alpha/beta hydrolase [Candidatus Daviesbacteria bacterium]